MPMPHDHRIDWRKRAKIAERAAQRWFLALQIACDYDRRRIEAARSEAALRIHDERYRQ